MRITQKDLESVINRLNETTNSPTEQYTRDDSGHLKANVGNYHLSMAYDGYKLERVCNEGGGASCPINTGFTTKRDLYNQLQAFINGIYTGKGEA